MPFQTAAALPLLLVEDDADLAATVEEYLARRGWEVEYAANGARALAMLLDRSYALMVLDQRLPGINGLDLCRRVRSGVAPQLPILMLTAADALEDRLAGFAAGVDDYLVKPFALPELAARLTALVRRTSEGRPRRAPSALCRRGNGFVAAGGAPRGTPARTHPHGLHHPRTAPAPGTRGSAAQRSGTTPLGRGTARQ